MLYNRIIFAFIFLFFFSICSSSDNVNNENDLTFLLHENLVNKLLLNFPPIEKEGKAGIIRYKIKISAERMLHKRIHPYTYHSTRRRDLI